MSHLKEVLIISKKIFIDAGHNDSKWNTGAQANNLREQDITFYISKKLSEILSKSGLETKLSRPTKETILGKDNKTSINLRYTMSNNWGADYFISVHCNSGGGTGAETLYYKKDSKKYAETIHNSYISNMNIVDRGVKYRNNIAVIKYAKAPAILIELGFIDNLKDDKILSKKQEEIAMSIAKGFFKLLNIKEKKILRYNTIEEVPEWGKQTIQKLIDKKILFGGNNGLNLTEDMIRILVINDRCGIYK